MFRYFLYFQCILFALSIIYALTIFFYQFLNNEILRIKTKISQNQIAIFFYFLYNLLITTTIYKNYNDFKHSQAKEAAKLRNFHGKGEQIW